MRKWVQHGWVYGLVLVVLGFTMQPALSADDEVFKLHVTQSRFLPEPMYGNWNIKATVVASDTPPGMFIPSTYEVWTLERDDKQVTIANLATSARAQVLVDNVKGNTATFHHETYSEDERVRIVETPTVTVIDDRMTGVNQQEIFFMDKHGKVRQVFHVTIAVEGNRLSQGRTRFVAPKDTIDDLDFVVEPLKKIP